MDYNKKGDVGMNGISLETFPYSEEAKESHDTCMALWREFSLTDEEIRSRKKPISLRELSVACMYVALKYITSYKCIELPVVPPELVDYHYRKDRAIENHEKFSIDPGFWRAPTIEKYLFDLGYAVNTNKGQMAQLKEMSDVIPQEDISAHLKIKDKLNEFAEFRKSKFNI